MTLQLTPTLEQINALEAERTRILWRDYLTPPEVARLKEIAELLETLWFTRRQELAPKPEPQKSLPRLEDLDDTPRRTPRLRGGKPRKYNYPRVLQAGEVLACPDCGSKTVWRYKRSAKSMHYQCQVCAAYFTQALPPDQWEPDTLPHCPRCGDILRRNGTSEGVQRYKCSNCTYRGALTAA